MTIRPSVAVRLISLLMVQLCAMVAAMPKSGLACDWAAIGAWQCTWNAPYALDTPLRGYFIPRSGGRCEEAVYSDGYGYMACNGCGMQTEGDVEAPGPCECDYPAQRGSECLSVRFERLGQIPNDLELGASLPSSAPGR
jgi:hypothetical protein